MVKDERVGLYIMPATRLKLNLIKAQIAMREGRPISQDEILQRMIRMFEHVSNGHTSHTYQEPTHAQS